jgi:sugar lactone lactonase YvrE
MRTLVRSLLITLTLFFVLSAPGFSAVKLRHIISVYLDAQQKGLKQPEGVACGKGDVFVVADSGNGRLVRFSFQGGSLLPGMDIKIPQLAYPVRVQIDGQGDIFALDERQRRIVHLSPEGEFKGYVEATGLPGSTTMIPRSFKIDGNGNMYILDISSANVVVLDANGKFVRNIAFPEQYGFISDLAVDFKGTILLVDSLESIVYAAAADGTKFTPLTQSMKETVFFPTSIATDTKGTIYLVDQNGGDIIIVGQDGSFQGRLLAMGWKEGLLRYPSQCCVNADGDFFVADRSNNRVQIFSIAD